MAEQRGTATTAGLAGAGGGTFFVALAQSMPHGAVRDVVLYLSPSISVVAGAIVFSVQQMAVRAMQKRLVERVRATAQKILKDPEATDAHKAKVRKQLEEAEQALLRGDIARIKILGRS